ncbi:uncharacterized protein METZ01_LOCUS311136, partial [marine metagenome]
VFLLHLRVSLQAHHQGIQPGSHEPALDAPIPGQFVFASRHQALVPVDQMAGQVVESQTEWPRAQDVDKIDVHGEFVVAPVPVGSQDIRRDVDVGEEVGADGNTD